jgi:hypothetical protein
MHAFRCLFARLLSPARGSGSRLGWPAVAPACHAARVERIALSSCPRLSDLPFSKIRLHSRWTISQVQVTPIF